MTENVTEEQVREAVEVLKLDCKYNLERLLTGVAPKQKPPSISELNAALSLLSNLRLVPVPEGVPEGVPEFAVVTHWSADKLIDVRYRFDGIVNAAKEKP